MNMAEFAKTLGLVESVTPMVTIWQVILGTMLAAMLSMVVGLAYRKVQAEGTYSQTLVHSFVLIAMVTSLIMLIIGSNIARAFSLVGALSIIRFRTAIKSPLDVAFVFAAVAIGMASGTGFYAAAILGVMLMMVVMLGLNHLNFASYPARVEYLLSVHFHVGVDYDSALQPLLGKLFDAYSLAYVESVKQGTQREVVYSVRPAEGVSDGQVMAKVAEVNDNLKVSYRVVRHAIEVP